MEINRYRSDVQKLLMDIKRNRGVDSKNTIDLCNQLENYGTKHQELELVGYARFTRAETFYLMNETFQFFKEIISCMHPLEIVQEWGYLAMANNLLGIMSVNRGQIPFALDYFFKAISYCEDYNLPEIACTIHMNLGNLYYQSGKYEDAYNHFYEGYIFIKEHDQIEGFKEKITAICVGLGKTHIALGEFEKAKKYHEEILREYMDDLVEADQLAVFCFEAKLDQVQGNDDALTRSMLQIDKHFHDQIPVMDLFDELYDYLQLLLFEKKYDMFQTIYRKLLGPTQKTAIKNLERKLIDLQICLAKEQGQKEQYETYAKDYYELSKCMEKEADVMISNIIMMRRDYHKLTRMNKEEHERNRYLQIQSETDPLTGLSNRLKLNVFGEEVFNRARLNNVGFGFEILDIDYFKEFNDFYGHQGGDDCLVRVAKQIHKMTEHNGIYAFRYGGDEFVILYEGYDEHKVFSFTKELKARISNAKIKHEATKISSKTVTISQGVFWGMPSDEDTIWDYLSEADHLLYKVKQESRNSIMLGKETGDTHSQKRSQRKRGRRPMITSM